MMQQMHNLRKTARTIVSLMALLLLALSVAAPAAEIEPAAPPPWKKSLQKRLNGTDAAATDKDAGNAEVARMDIAMIKQPIESVVLALSAAANKTIMLGNGAQQGQMVTAIFKNTPVEEALRSFAKAQQLCIVEQKGCILLVSRQEYLNVYARTEIVQLKHANPEALVRVVMSQAAGKSDLVTATGDTRTRTIIFKGDPEQISAVRDACLSLDHSMTSEIFTVRYASVSTVAKEINDALQNGGGGKDSPNGSVGSIVPDERSNRLIVHETPENIAFCRNIIDSLDVPVETRVFSTGSIDPKTIADQIKKGELGGTEKGDKSLKSSISADTTVQVVEGSNQIIVTDTPERLKILDRVMTELNGNIVTRVVQPRNSTPTQLAEMLKSAFPTVTVATDPRSGSLIITGHKERIEQVDTLIRQLDATENIQVEIESKIMLVAADKLKEYGVRIFGQDLDGLNETLANVSTNPNFPADSPKPEGAVMGSPPNAVLPNPIKKSGNFLEVLQPNIQVQAVVRALESDGDTKLLSNPRLRMLTGQTSNFFSGSKEPYKEVTFQANQSVENVKFIDVGVTFQVTPFVSPSRMVMLDVLTEFSNLRSVRDGIPVVDTRTAQSTVQAGSNETILLGGLISEESSQQWGGIPGLRSLPVVGVLFGEKRHSSQQRELIIAITPRILGPSLAEAGTMENIESKYSKIRQEFTPTAPAVPGKPDPAPSGTDKTPAVPTPSGVDSRAAASPEKP